MIHYQFNHNQKRILYNFILIKLIIKFKITRRKKNLQKKKKDHEMNHQNFLNRHARHRPRFVTSVSLLPVAAFRKTPLESKASFSLSIAWNYGLRILVLKRIGQPACCCCYCLSETILRKAVPRGGVEACCEEPVAGRGRWWSKKGGRSTWVFQEVDIARPAYGTFAYPQLEGYQVYEGINKYYITFDKSTMRL